VVDGLAGAWAAFQNYMRSAEEVSVAGAGRAVELLVVIGACAACWDRRSARLFFVMSANCFRFWKPNWRVVRNVFGALVPLLERGTGRHLGELHPAWWPRRKKPPHEKAQDLRRLGPAGLLMPRRLKSTVLDASRISKRFGGIRAVLAPALRSRRRDPSPDRPERRRQDQHGST